jgi:Bacterial membrane protein YfhO
MALPGEEGSLRIADSPESNPPAASLVTAAASAGSGWGWLSWQAGRYWQPYLSVAMTTFSPDIDDPKTRRVARRTSDALMRSGRLRWVLEDFITVPRLHVEPPWTRVAEAGSLALWEGPEVLPMGTLFGAYALFVGGSEWQQAPAIAAAFGRGILSIAGGDRLSQSSAAVIDAASIIHAVGADSLGDPASRQRASRHEDTVLDTREASAAARWATFLNVSAVRTPSAAGYSRPAPERMVLEADAGPAPAILFVSEAYHPLWRARVDGTPTEVLRAQIAFMAVRVPPGSHRVELELRPPLALRVADRVTQLSWIALAGAVLVAGTRALRQVGG